jgi:hypothetical protein
MTAVSPLRGDLVSRPAWGDTIGQTRRAVNVSLRLIFKAIFLDLVSADRPDPILFLSMYRFDEIEAQETLSSCTVQNH